MAAFLEIYDPSLTTILNSHDFGNINIGDESAPLQFKVKNNGDEIATTVRLFARTNNHLYSGQSNPAGQEIVTEQWVEMNDGGSYQPVGGDFGNQGLAGNYLAIADIPPGGASATINLKLVTQDPCDTIGAANLQIGVSYASEAGAIFTIIPGTGLTASGTTGGPFSPTDEDYSLEAFNDDISWQVVDVPDVNWVTITPASGTTLEGNTDNINIAFNANTNALAPGNYSTTIKFQNLTYPTQPDITRAVALTVNAAAIPGPTDYQNYWTFDTAHMSGATVNDQGPANYDGTFTGSMATVAGKFQQAAQAVIAGSYINFTQDIFSGASVFSISCWFKIETNCPGGQYLFRFVNASAQGITLLIQEDTEPNNLFGYIFYLKDSTGAGGNNFKNATQTLAKNTIYHLAIRWDKTVNGGVPELFINGSQVTFDSTSAATNNLATHSSKRQIFYESHGQLGWIDDFRTYNRSLTNGEITTLASG